MKITICDQLRQEISEVKTEKELKVAMDKVDKAYTDGLLWTVEKNGLIDDCIDRLSEFIHRTTPEEDVRISCM